MLFTSKPRRSTHLHKHDKIIVRCADGMFFFTRDDTQLEHRHTRDDDYISQHFMEHVSDKDGIDRFVVMIADIAGFVAKEIEEESNDTHIVYELIPY